jgi:hypothetical protein
MPGGGGVSVGLFTLGAAAGLPGSSPSHGLNPALVAGCGEVDSLDVPGVIVESAAPEVVEVVEEADDVVEGADDVVEEAVDGPAATPLLAVGLSQNPGLAIETVAATTYRKMCLLVLQIFLIEHCLIDCIE